MPVPSASGPSSSPGIQMLDHIGQGGLCAPDGAEGPEASGKNGEKPSHRAELGEFRMTPHLQQQIKMRGEVGGLRAAG